MSPTGDGTHRQDDAPSGVLGTSLARLNKNSQARVSGSRPRDPPVKTCKMQDVVLLPFPLTDLWGNSQPVYDEDAADEPTPHTYKGNSDQIPKEISDLCERIKGFKTNTAGLPMRTELRNCVRDHFSSRYGILRQKSALFKYVGDERLFSKKEWAYLTGQTAE